MRKLSRNQVEPVGAVSSKKLPLSIPLPAGASVSLELDYTCVAAATEDDTYCTDSSKDDRQLVNFM